MIDRTLGEPLLVVRQTRLSMLVGFVFLLLPTAIAVPATSGAYLGGMVKGTIAGLTTIILLAGPLVYYTSGLIAPRRCMVLHAEGLELPGFRGLGFLAWDRLTLAFAEVSQERDRGWYCVATIDDVDERIARVPGLPGMILRLRRRAGHEPLRVRLFGVTPKLPEIIASLPLGVAFEVAE